MKLKIMYLLAGLLCLAGPAAIGKEFPLCLYGVDNPADLKTVQKAGFTCIQTYQQDPAHLSQLAQAAQKRGLGVVFSPNQVLGSAYEQKAQQWPILAWYLVDEPDVHRWSRTRVLAAHQAAKTVWPQHQTALVIGQGKTATPYYDLPDIMMMDWYPVPHLPLTSFGDNVRWTKEGQERLGAAGRLLWGVVQIFDWKEFKQHRPDNDRIGRLPTRQEIRFMSYHGILNGATGLFYFIFTHQGDILPRSNPAHWTQVKTVVKELARFKKILESGTPAADPTAVQEPLLMKTWQYKGELYSVLLNTAAQAQPVPEELLQKYYRALYGTKKARTIAPYAVWILKR